jgi:hypothetical protein
MLSHEPKNYALLHYDGSLVLRGVAFRSSRAEPFGEAFLKKSIRRLLVGDVPGVRDAYLETLDALRLRALSTRDVSQRVRLTKTPERYQMTREVRREFPYEAMIASGRTSWSVGDRVRVYRTTGGGGRVAEDVDESDIAGADVARNYDVAHYSRLLRDTFAARLARALTAEGFSAVFADPDQLALFAPSLDTVRPILTPRAMSRII